MMQSDLARILELQRTSVSNIERGKQKPTLDTLLRFCEHFDLEIDALVPKLRDITIADARSVTVGGKAQVVSVKTASLLQSLRPVSRGRQ